MGSVRDYSTEKILLDPLGSLFSKLPEGKKTHYLDALKKLSDEELQDTFNHLRDNYQYNRFPTVADIMKAKKACARRPVAEKHPNGDTYVHPFVEKSKKQREMAKEYTELFMTAPLGRQAREGGYADSLREYVYNAAWVQAQMIEYTNSIAYKSCLFTPEEMQSKDFYHIQKKLFDEYHQQAQMGHIFITVPQNRIDHWSMYPDIKNPSSPPCDAPNENKRHIKNQVEGVIEKANNALSTKKPYEMPLNTDTSHISIPDLDADLVMEGVF